MDAVVAGPDRYVAVGRGGPGTENGVAWVSTDGATWHRASGSPSGGAPTGLIYDKLGFVAWGASSESETAWISPDGESWQRATDFPGLGEQSINGIARLGDNLVAVSDDLRMWTSPDGLAWQPVDNVTTTSRVTYLYGVTGAPGALVGWASVRTKNDVLRPVTLRTTDGQHWIVGGSGLKVDRFLVEGIADIVAVGDRLVAVGHGLQGEAGSRPPSSAAWTSTDGLTWKPARFRSGPTRGSLGSLSWRDGEYVALGSPGVGSIVWRSTNGRVWVQSESVPDSVSDGEAVGCTGGRCPHTVAVDLAVGPVGPVAVGTTDVGSGPSRAVVWLASTS